MTAGPGRRGAFPSLPGALVAALLWGLSGPAHAFTLTAPEAELPAEVRLTADSLHYDRQADRVEAAGHVKAVRGATTLTVDRLTWERATGVITAEGDVTILDGDSRLDADAIVWNLTDQTGRVDNGRLVIEGRYHLQGRRMERLGPDRYEVDAGLFSTCPCRRSGRRDWSVTARRMRMRVPGTLVARSVAFRVADVPVFYLPVFLFPTSQRQTGLLIPNMGFDTRDGARFVQPFYWAIDPSHDLTVSLDLRSRRGTGSEVAYRYMASRATRGDLRVFALSDKRTGQVQGEGHWRHTTRRGGGWTWHADVNAVNDRSFLRELSTGTEERTADRLESNLFAIRSRGDDALMLLARRTTDLNAPSDTTVQQFPRLRAERFPVRVGTLPVWGSAYVDGSYLYRATGATAVRVDAQPELTTRVPLWGGRLTAVPRAAARLIAYSSGAEGSGGRLTEAYPLSLTVSGRAVGRLWGRPHALVPEARYRYAPVNAAGVEPFDALETLRTEHEAELALRQALGPVRWDLTSAYDLEEGRSLPFRSELEAALGRKVDVQLDTFHDAGTGRIDRLMADWRVRWRWGTVSAGTVYDRGTVGVGTPLAPGSLLGTGSGARSDFHSIGLALGPWRGWRLTQRAYYDQQDGRMAEARYGIRYHGTCWTAEFTYVDLPTRNLVQFRIGLVGPPEAEEVPPEVRKPVFGPPAPYLPYPPNGVE